VPSAGIASKDWTYGPGFQFTTNALKPDTCRGVSLPIRPAERIKDGRYQLPGTTDYYGDDGKGSALIGALSGDLDADATFTASARCGQFDYGNGALSGGVPTAPPQSFPSQERKPSALASVPAVLKKAVACATRMVKARGTLSAIRLACRLLTFKLRRGARVRVEQLRGARDDVRRGDYQCTPRIR
jgi:hypothetical protein